MPFITVYLRQTAVAMRIGLMRALRDVAKLRPEYSTATRPDRPPFLLWTEPPGSGRLRALVTFDDDQVGCRDRRPQLDRFLVFGRFPAIDRRLVAGKLDYRIAASARPLDGFGAAGPHQEAGAELAQWPGVGRDVGLVPFRIGDVDAYDPVTLCHDLLLLYRRPINSPRRVTARPSTPTGSVTLAVTYFIAAPTA